MTEPSSGNRPDALVAALSRSGCYLPPFFVRLARREFEPPQVVSAFGHWDVKVSADLTSSQSGKGETQIETASFLIFVAVLLSIPFFLGRGLYRSFVTRKRIEQEARELLLSSGRIVGFTKQADTSESSFLEHFAIVEYETAENEVVWAESQSCEKQNHRINSVVDIMCRPRRDRSVMMLQDRDHAPIVLSLEKNLEVGLSILCICILFGVVVGYHGFAAHILGPLVVMLGVGFAFGHVTIGENKREKQADEDNYRQRCERLAAAQKRGIVPCQLSE